MQDIDLDLLRCFTAVAEARNFTVAGVRLGRSQSAVSVKIKKLEHQFGCQFLIRNNHDVRLTDQGYSLLIKARRLLDQGERLLAEMRAPLVSGRLRIGILEYVAPHRIPELLSALQRRLPEAQLQFRVGLSKDLRAALDLGSIDLALALHDPDSDTSIVIANDPLIWVEGEHDYSSQFGPKQGIDLCLMEAPCVYRQAALEVLSRKKIEYREVMIGSSVQSVRSAVISGMGMSVLGASCLGDGLRPARHMDHQQVLPQATLSLHGTDHRKSEVVTVMREVLTKHLRGELEVIKHRIQGNPKRI